LGVRGRNSRLNLLLKSVSKILFKIIKVFGAAFFKKLRKSRLFCKKGGAQKTFITIQRVVLKQTPYAFCGTGLYTPYVSRIRPVK
jgi:hypothetical protein